MNDVQNTRKKIIAWICVLFAKINNIIYKRYDFLGLAQLLANSEEIAQFL